MTARLLGELETVIDMWIKRNCECESEDWPDAYFYEGEERDMARAAAAVFDASVAGQKFLKRVMGTR